MTESSTLHLVASDPLLPAPCLLCGERFEPEGYSDACIPELLPGVRVEGFALGLYREYPDGRAILVGFVCPGCFRDRRVGPGERCLEKEGGSANEPMPCN